MGYSINNNHKFINPYNFVGVNWEKTERKSISESKGNLTGVITCRIITKTPLAIPDEEVSGKEHKCYSFMRTPENPQNHEKQFMIPGSSLRGMLRSVYETVTDSCFVTSNENQRITKRTRADEASKTKPGILKYEDGQWNLYQAKRFLIMMEDKEYNPFNKKKYSVSNGYSKYKREDLKKYRFGELVYFSHGTKKSKKRKGNNKNIVKSFSNEKSKTTDKEGYLYIGEVPPLNYDEEKNEYVVQTSKHFESIFCCGKNINEEYKEIVLTSKDIEVIKLLVEKYNNKAVNKCKTEHEWYDGVLDAIDDKREVPIWYRIDNGRLILSLAAIGRVVFQKNMGVLLGKREISKDESVQGEENKIELGKTKCKKRDALCKACSLFGMAGDEGVGSRIRVSDAILDENQENSNEKEPEKVKLKELSSPKSSYLPFYSTNTYNSEQSANSYDEEGVQLRGRKYYWHTDKCVYKSSVETERNATMELLNKNKEFVFNIFFDSITDAQLEELKWVITLGENNRNSNLCHKLGHGKPIGLGSVKIIIESIKTKTYTVNEGYKIDDYSTVLNDNVQLENVDELLCISDLLKTKNQNVVYPYVVDSVEGEKDNNKAAHQWFSYNISKDNKKKRVLPKIKDTISKPLKAINYVVDGSDEKDEDNLEYEVNKEYKGIVKKYKDKKKAVIKLDHSTVVVHICRLKPYVKKCYDIADVLKCGMQVTLIYKGKTENGKFDNWECWYNK